MHFFFFETNLIAGFKDLSDKKYTGFKGKTKKQQRMEIQKSDERFYTFINKSEKLCSKIK
jgi:hypothetical protein